MRRLISLSIFLGLSLLSWSQTGPGGVNVEDLELWLKPENIIHTGDGSNVTGWTDASGKGNDLDDHLQTTLGIGDYPKYVASSANGQPAVDFDGIDDGLFSPLNANITADDNWTVFAVFKVDLPNQVENHGNLWGSFGEALNFAILKAQNGNGTGPKRVFSVDGLGGTNSNAYVALNGERNGIASSRNPSSPTKWEDGQYAIGTANYTSINNDISHHGMGVIMDSDNSSLFLSGGNEFWFSGEIAEIIVFSRPLDNSTEYLRVTNYLAEKYGIDIISNTTNTAYDGAYPSNYLFLGHENDETFNSNVGDGDAIYLEADGTFGTNDQIFVSNNDVNHDETNDDVSGGYSRWAKIYKVDRTDVNGGIIDFELSFGTQDANLGDNNKNGNTAADYRLLYRSSTTGDFTDLGITPVLDSDLNKITFTVDDAILTSGYYTLGVPLGNTWYSYLVNGDWSNPDTWTLDPSGTLYENDGAEIPSANDRVVVLNGKTVYDDLGLD